MGKKYFEHLYSCIKEEFGNVTCKISCSSDEFDPKKDYTGIIVYSVNGQFSWMNDGGRTKGHKGKSFYTILVKTENIPNKIKEQEGVVHGNLLLNAFGVDWCKNKSFCCGGFSYHQGTLKFNSWTLNGSNQICCESDGNNNLSDHEKEIVKYCFEKYKSGARSAFEMPNHIEKKILNNYNCYQEVAQNYKCIVM